MAQRQIAAERNARYRLAVVVADTSVEDMDDLPLPTDAEEIAYTGRRGCFQIGYGGQKVVLDGNWD